MPSNEFEKATQKKYPFSSPQPLGSFQRSWRKKPFANKRISFTTGVCEYSIEMQVQQKSVRYFGEGVQMHYQKEAIAVK